MSRQRTTATGLNISSRGRLDIILLLNASGHPTSWGIIKMTDPAT